MKAFDYIREDKLDNLVELLSNHNGNGHNDDDIKLLAGGTDLLTLMKSGITSPANLVDIKRVNEIPNGIERDEGGITLGALTTLSAIETSPLLQSIVPLLAQAAATAATPQLRNQATLGGNLLQRPRCWYFRNPLFHCWLAGGDDCPAQHGRNQFHALFASEPCCAVHPSDLATALLALDANVHLVGTDGERTMPFSEFYVLPQRERRQETDIHNDEILLSVHIPTQPAATHSVYLKAMDRKVWAFALVSVAAVVTIEQDNITGARMVLGGVAPIPWRSRAAEKEIIGRSPSSESFAAAATTATATAQPLNENGYKVSLLQSLIRKLPESLVAHKQYP